MEKVIHLISLTIPFPPTYGGAIDIFYKIKHLNKIGVNIILHCYEYNGSKSKELDKYCKEVYYYKRSRKLWHHFSDTPFIVKSRKNNELAARLNKDNHSILVEGLHCAYVLKQVNPDRIFIRTHNIEHLYYHGLYKASSSFLKKAYYWLESKKLKNFESNLKTAKALFNISKSESSYFNSINNRSFHIPPFHQFTSVTSKPGRGEYILLHGNFMVEENISSALYLINKILKDIDVPLIIAGKNPAQQIINAANKMISSVQIIKNPSIEHMDKIIQNAQLILLHTHQSTGIKLKLLYSLFEGRYCLCNENMLVGTGLETICEVASDHNEWKSKTIRFFNESFSSDKKNHRAEILNSTYNNDASAVKISNIMFDKSEIY